MPTISSLLRCRKFRQRHILAASPARNASSFANRWAVSPRIAAQSELVRLPSPKYHCPKNRGLAAARLEAPQIQACSPNFGWGLCKKNHLIGPKNHCPSCSRKINQNNESSPTQPLLLAAHCPWRRCEQRQKEISEALRPQKGDPRYAESESRHARMVDAGKEA